MVHGSGIRGPSGPCFARLRLCYARRVASIEETPAGREEVIDALDAATRAIAGLVSVEEVLQVIVEPVRPLVGARYAALGTVDDRGVIERFITSGMSDATRARSDPCPAATGSWA